MDYEDIYAIISSSNYDLDDGLAAAKAIYGKQYNPIFTFKALSYFENEELTNLDRKIKDELIQWVNSSKGEKNIRAFKKIGDSHHKK